MTKENCPHKWTVFVESFLDEGWQVKCQDCGLESKICDTQQEANQAWIELVRGNKE